VNVPSAEAHRDEISNSATGEQAGARIQAVRSSCSNRTAWYTKQAMEGRQREEPQIIEEAHETMQKKA
jgi:hypothetical protein